MRLEAFITDLLYEHDCVVVPGFGGLVANYRQAKLNRLSHVIHPPSKHIGFNKNLTSNDGLLTQHIAAVLGVSYSQALSRIEETVAEYRHQLRTNGRLVWEKLGVFFIDKADQIQFIPEEQENFLLSSFGLQPVQLKIVEREEPQSETNITPIETGGKKQLAIWKVAAAAAIPMLLGAGLLLRNEMKQNSNFTLSSLNPFRQEKIIASYEPRNAPSALLVEPFAEKEIIEPKTSIGEKTTAPVENIKPIESSKPILTDKKKYRPKSSSKLQGKHAVIGGAFKVKENANRFLQKLRSEGFDAQFAGKKGDLTLVAYGIYNTAQEAETAITNILSDSEVHAWIKHF